MTTTTRRLGMTFAAGSGSETLTPAGMIETITTSAATTAVTTVETLASYSLPANTLNANGRGVRVTARGRCAANANTKTIRANVGGTDVLQHGAGAYNGVGWRLQFEVIRTGASAQVVGGSSTVGTSPNTTGLSSTLALDTTAAITIAITGQNGSANANDIVFDYMTVEFF